MPTDGVPGRGVAHQLHRRSDTLDSLDGDISQLAVLTGGDVHIATGTEIRSCLRAGIQDFRHPASWPRKLPDHDGARVTRRGMDITITRGAPAAEVEDHRFARAVGALSAGLALPGMAPDAAAELAEAEGLVTHLTSLVMVDDAGERCDGFPVTRKIPLATPRDIMSIGIKARRKLRDPSRSRMLRSFASGDKEVQRDTDPLDQGNLATWGASIDWQTEGSRLIEGDLSGLPALQVIFLEKMARHPRLIEAAGELGMDALLVLIGLIARTRSTPDRTAKRVANRLLGENAVSGVSV